MEKVLAVGMDYNEAKKLFPDINETVKAELSWFKTKPGYAMYGMIPEIQVTGKEGKVVEILAEPDWEKYTEKGDEKAKSLWNDCVNYMVKTYGEPTKEKDDKKIWRMEGLSVKVILENKGFLTVSVLIY